MAGGNLSSGLKAILFFLSLSMSVFGHAQGTCAEEFQVSSAFELQNALSTAAGNQADDVIKIARGNYQGNFTYDEDRGAVEDFDLIFEGGYDSTFTARIVDPENTVLDGGGAGRVLMINHEGWTGVDCIVDGVTLKNGAGGTHGGGLYVRNPAGPTTLSNCIVTANQSSTSGGGVFLYTGSLAMRNSQITGNHSNNGGGLSLQGGGGGVTLTDNIITVNSSGYVNGGILLEGGRVTLAGNTISGNWSTYLGTGGVECRATTSVTVVNNTITGNSVADSVVLTTDVGGIKLRGPDITVTNNTITGNTCSADGDGGGLYLLGTGSTTIAVYNNIIYGNTGGDANDNAGRDLSILANGDDTVSFFNNDLDQSPGGIYMQTPFSIDAGNLDNSDPLFVDPDNGDYHLQETSPCRDAGTNSAAELPFTDKDGESRVMNSLADMGAYEYVDTAHLAAAAVALEAFDTTVVGESTRQTCTITNEGDAALVIWDLAIEGAHAAQFSLDNDACSRQTLAPSQSCSLDIDFSPTSVGAKSAILSIPSNDREHPTLKRPLAGDGTTGGQSLQLTIEGGRYASPGEQYSFVIYYANFLGYTAEDVVVQVSLPVDSRYVDSGSEGIYRSRNHEVFWRLGDVPAGGSGQLGVNVAFRWGIPGHTFENIIAHVDATNAPEHQLEDLDAYLDYAPVTLTTNRPLTEDEIAAVLNSNTQLNSLYRLCLDMGFVDYGAAKEVAYSTGASGVIISLLKPETFDVVFVKMIDDVCFAEKLDVGRGTQNIFDTTGGREYNLWSDTSTGWGAWVETDATSAQRATIAASGSCDDPSKLDCLENCMADAGYDFIWSPINALIEEAKLSGACTACIMGGDEFCEECMSSLLGLLAGDDVPYLGEGLAAVKCLQDCLLNPKSHTCSEDHTFCWTGGYDPLLYMLYHSGTRVVGTKECDLSTCKYEPVSYTYCNFCEGCIDGKCNAHIDICKGDPEIIVAGDPNDKTGFQGDILPGQTIDYTINYENYGEGTAFGVYIVDELDADLDDTTLVIGNDGQYFPSSRLLMWNIGALASEAGGSVGFSVDVEDMLASGTEIVNAATVYFPSVPEVTPTNVVVNRVRDIAAHPQSLEVTSGEDLALTLTGADAGGGVLTYQLVADPSHGTLTGTAPAVVYTSQTGFSGQDSFRFAVNNGSADSKPAEVKIRVNASGTDSTPPEVAMTHPADAEQNVTVYAAPVADDKYLPAISAVFSEPMSGDTVNATTFTVDGVAGSVFYDDLLQKAVFFPALPLSHATTYTATLSTGIEDSNGNSLAADHTWQFTTHSAVNISVILQPPNDDSIEFEAIAVGASSSGEIITVASTGRDALSISSLSLTGTDAGSFDVISNSCSGTIRFPDETCTVKVIFKPESSGMKTADLHIASNDPDTPDFVIPLAGSASTGDDNDEPDDDDGGGGSGGGCFITTLD